MNPDDFSIGDFITVLKGQPIYGNSSNFDTLTITGDDNSYKGDVLEITAIDLPYIVVKHRTGWGGKEPSHLDIRRWTFKKLTPEYVKALGVKP